MEQTDHPIWGAIRDLPAWQKAALGVTGVLLSPWALFLALITGLSIWPLLLVGRFQGNLGKKPLERDVVRALKRQRQRTEQYYQST